MSSRPNKWIVGIGLLMIVLAVRALVSGDQFAAFPSEDAVVSPSSDAVQTAVSDAEKVLSAAGLEGAQQYSWVCYDALAEAQQIQALDRCYAFDATVAQAIAEANRNVSGSSWFTAEEAQDRWRLALRRMGLSGDEMDARRLAILQSVDAGVPLQSIPNTAPAVQSDEALSASPAPAATSASAESDPVLEVEPQVAEPAEVVPRQPPERDLSRPAQPDGQARWARRAIENYPSRALRREIEGTVGVTLTIAVDGRASSCSVSSTSGSDILDEAACADLQRYARFVPAFDSRGTPTAGTWGTNVVYAIN